MGEKKLKEQSGEIAILFWPKRVAFHDLFTLLETRFKPYSNKHILFKKWLKHFIIRFCWKQKFKQVPPYFKLIIPQTHVRWWLWRE